MTSPTDQARRWRDRHGWSIHPNCSQRSSSVNKQASNRLGRGLVAVRLLAVYVLLGLFKHLVPLRWLARWAWCPPVGPRDRAAERGLAAIVLRLSQLTGLPDRDCLQRSLLLYRVLSRAGAAPVLIIGFGRIDGTIRGHAWVMVDNQPVVQEAELPQFSPAFGFGVGGFMFRATESYFKQWNLIVD